MWPLELLCGYGEKVGSCLCWSMCLCRVHKPLLFYIFSSQPPSLSTLPAPLWSSRLISPPFRRPRRGNPILLIKQGAPGQELKYNLQRFPAAKTLIIQRLFMLTKDSWPQLIFRWNPLGDSSPLIMHTSNIPPTDPPTPLFQTSSTCSITSKYLHIQ